MSADATPALPRVLFVDHSAVLGGAELSLLDLASAFAVTSSVVLFEHGPFEDALKARGSKVRVLGGAEALKGVKKSGGLASIGAAVAVVRSAVLLAGMASAYELLYTNTPKSFVIGAAAALLARRPVVWHLRDILSEDHFSRTNVRLLVRIANVRASAVVANSRATAAAFVAAGGRADLVHVVHNGIDAAPFDAVAAGESVVVRRELGIQADAFVVGSFSRLHPWKGQRVLLAALDTLKGVHALVVGGALFSGERDYEAELLTRASHGSLAGRVHLLGARSDVPRLMAACDLIVHTSTSPEPFGRVLVEAALAQRPIVAADGGGVREVVEDGTTALVVPAGDAARLAHAISTLMADRPRAAAMAAAASAHVRRDFTATAMVRGVEEVIRAVLAGGRA